MLFSKAQLCPQDYCYSCFALMSPLGSYTANYIEHITLYRFILPFVVGVLFHISTTILFESSKDTRSTQKILAILLGIGTAILV